MGYCTHYDITRSAPLSTEETIARFAEALCVNRENLSGVESMKWYEHQRDISRLMLEHGITEVDLHGEGEEQGDVWDKEFRVVDGAVTVKTYSYELTRPAIADEDRCEHQSAGPTSSEVGE